METWNQNIPKSLLTGWRFLNWSCFSTIDIWIKKLEIIGWDDSNICWVVSPPISQDHSLNPNCAIEIAYETLKSLKPVFFLCFLLNVFPISHDVPHFSDKKQVVSLPHSQGRSIASERPKRFQRLGSLSCSAEKPPPLSLICIYIYIYIFIYSHTYRIQTYKIHIYMYIYIYICIYICIYIYIYVYICIFTFPIVYIVSVQSLQLDVYHCFSLSK